MKLNIFKTSNEFLDEPTKIATCGDFLLKEDKDCKCKEEANNIISKEIAVVDFGKHMYDCQRGCVQTCHPLLASRRKTKANPDLVCQCSC